MYFFLVLTGSLPGCGGKSNDSLDNEVLAQAGSALFRVKDFKEVLPEKEELQISTAQAKAYIQKWINAELLRQEAVRRGLHKRDAIKRALSNAERDLLASALLEEEIAKIIDVSDEEIRAYYNQHQEMFMRAAEEVRASQILVGTIEEANRLRIQLRSGAAMDTLARIHSLDPSGQRGGDMGYFSREQVLPQLASAAFTLSINSISRPIKTDFGYHILKVIERQPPETVKDLSQVEDIIREEIIAAKIREARRTLITNLKSNTLIVERYDLLSSLLPDSSAAPMRY